MKVPCANTILPFAAKVRSGGVQTTSYDFLDSYDSCALTDNMLCQQAILMFGLNYYAVRQLRGTSKVTYEEVILFYPAKNEVIPSEDRQTLSPDDNAYDCEYLIRKTLALPWELRMRVLHFAIKFSIEEPSEQMQEHFKGRKFNFEESLSISDLACNTRLNTRRCVEVCNGLLYSKNIGSKSDLAYLYAGPLENFAARIILIAELWNAQLPLIFSAARQPGWCLNRDFENRCGEAYFAVMEMLDTVIRCYLRIRTLKCMVDPGFEKERYEWLAGRLGVSERNPQTWPRERLDELGIDGYMLPEFLTRIEGAWLRTGTGSA